MCNWSILFPVVYTWHAHHLNVTCLYAGVTFGNRFTLNLCLVHYKVLVVAAALKLFPMAAVETHFFILQLVKGEQGGREATITTISGQDGQWFLLEYRCHYTLQTHSNAQLFSVHIINSPSPYTCPHTCPQTCFGWQRWKEVLVWHCLAGGNTLWKWHCRLKQTEQTKMLFANMKKNSFHQFGLSPLTLDEKVLLGLSQCLMRSWPGSGLDQSKTLKCLQHNDNL